MQYEHGFGAPDEWLDTPPGLDTAAHDLGFGSPTDLGEWGEIDLAESYGDTGFGSPLTILFIAASPPAVRDIGGQIVRAAAAWPIVGPYGVEIVDAAGGAVQCYGCRPGEGQQAGDCYTDSGRSTLTFACPPLPVGTYDLRVTWVDGTLQSTTVAEALSVYYRARHGLVYDVRSAFPPGAYTLSARTIAAERVLGG